MGLILWGIRRDNEGTKMLASHAARVHFDKDRAFRLWGTTHGGVCVPADERTPPDPQ